MPRKAKTEDQDQKLLLTGIESEDQPLIGETQPGDADDGQPTLPDENQTEPDVGDSFDGLDEEIAEPGFIGGEDTESDTEESLADRGEEQPEFPEDEHAEMGTGDSQSGHEEYGSLESGGYDLSDEEPDPALDPALVIPTIPIKTSTPELDPEVPVEPQPAKPKAKRAKAVAASKDPALSETVPAKRAGAAKPVAKPAEKQQKKEAPKRVVSIDDEMSFQTDIEKEAFLWMELRHSLRGKRILTGTLGGVERSANGLCTAVVYYKGQRIIIPASEMSINIGNDVKNDQKLLYNRYAQILNRSLGAEMDFIVSGIDKRGNSVVASRKAALIRKQQNFYLPTNGKNALIVEGQIVEARVISVGDKNVRVEAFGVETSILARDVAWEWVDDCADYHRIGERVLIKILRIDTRDPQNILIGASIRDVISNPVWENIKKCTVQGKYIGRVTGVDQRAIYVRLNVGVNALAIAIHDRKMPSRKDDVSFVITRIDQESGIVIGIITKVIKHFV